jgi:hypothetical protein
MDGADQHLTRRRQTRIGQVGQLEDPGRNPVQYRLTAAFIGVTPPGVVRRFAGISARRLAAQSRPQKN